MITAEKRTRFAAAKSLYSKRRKAQVPRNKRIMKEKILVKKLNPAKVFLLFGITVWDKTYSTRKIHTLRWTVVSKLQYESHYQNPKDESEDPAQRFFASPVCVQTFFHTLYK